MKFGAKFAKEADQLVKELKELAKKPKTSYQEAKEFVEKAVQFAQKAAKPPDETLKQFQETTRKAVYAWCVQAKTVVAVVKFEKLDGNILYEARYTNCGEKQKHAEDFFQEDIEKGKLGEKVKANPNGTITLYLTLQPCNKSTSIEGTANTPKDKTCCETLTTIVNEILLPREIKLCVKAADTCRLSLTKEKYSDDETLRKNAVDGIKMLMQAGVDVSGMTKDDWDYLLAMTNPDVPRNYHERRKDLDKSVQKTFTDIKAQIKKPKKQSSSKKS
jgi:polyhydroxyalkanoate synthesis regulator phasin